MLEPAVVFPGVPMPAFASSFRVASLPRPLFAAGGAPTVAGVPIEFILFALTLLGVALFHGHTFTSPSPARRHCPPYKIAFTGFKTGGDCPGFPRHLGHEWVVLATLLPPHGLRLLARHFEKSHVPVILPRFLPDDWKGGFVLLVMVWFISSFRQHRRGADRRRHGPPVVPGQGPSRLSGSHRRSVQRRRAWSVVGDTTTTMMGSPG